MVCIGGDLCSYCECVFYCILIWVLFLWVLLFCSFLLRILCCGHLCYVFVVLSECCGVLGYGVVANDLL